MKGLLDLSVEGAILLDRDLMQMVLGLEAPWTVADVTFDKAEGRMDLTLTYPKGSRFPCPSCGVADQPVHDTQERTWRHLDIFQHRAYLHAKVPRINCTKCGVKQVAVSWARPGSGFTLLFEALTLQLAKHMAVTAVAETVRIHPDSVWRILDHYVEQARLAQELGDVTALGIDEVSRLKGHDYVTTFCDLGQGRVLYVAEGRTASTIKSFVQDFEARGAERSQIREVCTDMCGPFLKGLAENLPDAEITFDRYHVMALVNLALDDVRRKEVKANEVLRRSRYLFLKNEANLTTKQRAKLESLKDLDLKTVRAYHLKVALQRLWTYKRRDFAEAYLKRWFWWATHSRIPQMRAVAHTIKRHWEGILRFVRSRITNGITEGLNGKIKEAARRAYGFKTFHRYRTIIYLVAGRLNLPTQTC